MTRKEWLETFLKLADNDAPCVDYRKKLRIVNAKDLSHHIRKLTDYRHELKAINDNEARVAKLKATRIKSAKIKKVKRERLEFEE